MTRIGSASRRTRRSAAGDPIDVRTPSPESVPNRPFTSLAATGQRWWSQKVALQLAPGDVRRSIRSSRSSAGFPLDERPERPHQPVDAERGRCHRSECGEDLVHRDGEPIGETARHQSQVLSVVGAHGRHEAVDHAFDQAEQRRAVWSQRVPEIDGELERSGRIGGVPGGLHPATPAAGRARSSRASTRARRGTTRSVDRRRGRPTRATPRSGGGAGPNPAAGVARAAP